jgi:polyisoprenoid-binding protein YceI
MQIVRFSLLAALVTFPLLAQTAAPAGAAEVFVIDPAHSSVEFKIRHLMTPKAGKFREVDGAVHINRAEPAKSSVEFTIKTASIDTGEPDRDEHLRSPDFFEVAKYPTISFRSSSVTPKSATQFDVAGDLTMHGVTKRVVLPVTFLGFGKDGRGKERAGFSTETTLDRKDYGITWNRILDEGGVLLGDEVKVSIDLEVVKR